MRYVTVITYNVRGVKAFTTGHKEFSV